MCIAYEPQRIFRIRKLSTDRLSDIWTIGQTDRKDLSIETPHWRQKKGKWEFMNNLKNLNLQLKLKNHSKKAILDLSVFSYHSMSVVYIYKVCKFYRELEVTRLCCFDIKAIVSWCWLSIKNIYSNRVKADIEINSRICWSWRGVNVKNKFQQVRFSRNWINLILKYTWLEQRQTLE